MAVDVGGAVQRKLDHASPNREVGETVDQDEGARLADRLVGVECDRLVRRDVAEADLVQPQRRTRTLLKRVDVDLVPDRRHRRLHRLRTDLQHIGMARGQRVFMHPEDVGGELVRDFRPRIRHGEHVPARSVDLVLDHQRDRLASPGDGQVAIGSDQRLYLRNLARLRDDNFIARLDRARNHCARETPEIEIGAVHPLDRQAEGRIGALVGNLDLLEMLQQGRASVPGHGLRRVDDVVAVQRRHRDWRDRLEAEIFGHGQITRHDLVEARPAVVHQVHLVDSHNEVTDAQHVGDVGVALGLLQHALARINQNDGEVGRRCAGRHVARVLLMAGGIGDNELALVGREEAVGDVNRDALFALGLQPVEQKGKVHLLALRAVLDAVLLERGELVLEQQLGVKKQPADQRRLAIIDRTAGDEAQHAHFGRREFAHRLALLLGTQGGHFRGHQKYPSRFFFSIDPLSSWSIRRPDRSDVRAVSISPTMSSSVAASLSMAAVSG